MRTAAEGYQAAVVAQATGEAERFSLLLDEYQAAPEVTRKRLWLQTLEEVLAENRKVVGADSRQLIYVPMGGDGRGGQGAGGSSAPPVVPPEVVAPTTGTPSSDSSSLPRPPRQPRTNEEPPR